MIALTNTMIINNVLKTYGVIKPCYIIECSSIVFIQALFCKLPLLDVVSQVLVSSLRYEGR